MRIKRHDSGYMMWLSATDTYNWATRPNATWPCSTLRDKRLVVTVDSNGLCDLSVNGRDAGDDIDGHELGAIVADHCPEDLRHYWPCWELIAGRRDEEPQSVR